MNDCKPFFIKRIINVHFDIFNNTHSLLIHIQITLKIALNYFDDLSFYEMQYSCLNTNIR